MLLALTWKCLVEESIGYPCVGVGLCGCVVIIANEELPVVQDRVTVGESCKVDLELLKSSNALGGRLNLSTRTMMDEIQPCLLKIGSIPTPPRKEVLMVVLSKVSSKTVQAETSFENRVMAHILLSSCECVLMPPDSISTCVAGFLTECMKRPESTVFPQAASKHRDLFDEAIRGRL